VRFYWLMASEDQAYRIFQRHVDRLCFLIVATDCSDREIDIERLHLRTQAIKLFPDKIPLYDLIYERRFQRLREQFRPKQKETGIWL
jgi:hypothetical protein